MCPMLEKIRKWPKCHGRSYIKVHTIKAFKKVEYKKNIFVTRMGLIEKSNGNKEGYLVEDKNETW